MMNVTSDQLHALIADAVWVASFGDALESPCELADAVLRALSMATVGDGPSGHVTPFPHPHTLEMALEAEAAGLREPN